MDIFHLKELFQKLYEATNVADIGCHMILNGRLKPVYKTETDQLGMERWRTVHEENPVLIKNTPILNQIMNDKKPLSIYDTKHDPRSAEEFFLFGVDSVMILPIVREKEVNAIISIVSIGKLHLFTKEEMDACVELIIDYLEYL